MNCYISHVISKHSSLISSTFCFWTNIHEALQYVHKTLCNLPKRHVQQYVVWTTGDSGRAISLGLKHLLLNETRNHTNQVKVPSKGNELHLYWVELKKCERLLKSWCSQMSTNTCTQEQSRGIFPHCYKSGVFVEVKQHGCVPAEDGF